MFGDLRDRLDPPAVHRDVPENRSGGEVVIPQTVVYRLEMPHAFAGLRVEADEAFGKQVLAGPRAAVVVAGSRFERQVDVPKLLVRADERPDAAVPGIGP